MDRNSWPPQNARYFMPQLNILLYSEMSPVRFQGPPYFGPNMQRRYYDNPQSTTASSCGAASVNEEEGSEDTGRQ